MRNSCLKGHWYHQHRFIILSYVVDWQSTTPGTLLFQATEPQCILSWEVMGSGLNPDPCCPQCNSTFQLALGSWTWSHWNIMLGLDSAINDVRFITLSYLWSEDLRLFHCKRFVSLQQTRLGVLLFYLINLSKHVPYYVLFNMGEIPIYLYYFRITRARSYSLKFLSI